MNALALGWNRTRLELKMYLREKEAVLFSFLFPILMLLLFATIFSSQFDDPDSKAIGMTAGRLFLPGMISAGVLLTSFQTMAVSVATERDDGTLKRLRSTPMPPVAYFLGKVGLVIITSLVQMAALLVIARVLYDVPMPTTSQAWLTFAWTLGLGVFGGTVLGIAYSSVASARSMTAVVVGPMLVLQFISGIYFRFSTIPEWLQTIAAFFPLKWIAQSMRSVFYPDFYSRGEMAGAWEHGRTAAVLAAWAIGGLILCVTTFRWHKRGSV